MIGILNYGVGNLHSISRMIEKVGGQASIVSSPNEMIGRKKIILPGVGHFSEGVRELKRSGLWGQLLISAQDKKILIMGICLGMQLLCKHSEEGGEEGLGLIDASVEKFDFKDNKKLKIPHMGWNTLRAVRSSPILPMSDEVMRFYFVHSYKVVPSNSDIIIGQCNYGGEFCAAYQQENIFGVQFHPEKSHRFGMELMKRFVEL